MENYANAARQADIYKKIKTRLDDPSNDLLEELDRQREVEYEAVRNQLVNDEYALLARAKKEGWDEKTTSFLRDSLYAKFAEDDMKLKSNYANMQQEWGFIDKEVANRVRKGELNPQKGEAEQVARDLKMRKLGYQFPGRVRNELDKAAALALSQQLQATGVPPRDADWMAGVPVSLHGRAGQDDNEKKIARFNELRGQGVPPVAAAGRVGLNLSKFGMTAGQLRDDYTEEEIDAIFGPASVSDANVPAAGGTNTPVQEDVESQAEMPTVFTQAEVDALPKGAIFRTPNGKKFRKN